MLFSSATSRGNRCGAGRNRKRFVSLRSFDHISQTSQRSFRSQRRRWPCVDASPTCGRSPRVRDLGVASLFRSLTVILLSNGCQGLLSRLPWQQVSNRPLSRAIDRRRRDARVSVSTKRRRGCAASVDALSVRLVRLFHSNSTHRSLFVEC